ncbi:MAG: CoA ester lyase [Pseudomonadales bacterium]|nr:CoA ester lyase [Pseudomonadales bacterium]
MIPRRSVLYMPAANSRALNKARSLDCDAIIFDLEDAVAVDAKVDARNNLVSELKQGGYGYRERIVRVNDLSSEWCDADVSAVAGLDIHGVLFPKVESAKQLRQAQTLVDAAGGAHLALWAMLETPRGILNADAIVCESERLTVLVMGTSDLVAELRGQHTSDRAGIQNALQHCVMVARARDRDILDGVHLEFKDQEAFMTVCEQGRSLGFDGKTLIHPTQIEGANLAFGLSDSALGDAREIVEAWENAQKAGKGVAVVNGRLIENLHFAEAQRTIEFSACLAAR